MSVNINIQNITKSFGEIQALNNVSLDIDQGELFGFIGPDGSGKTSLFRILTSLLLPDSGTVSVDGLDVVKDFKKIRNITGYMPGRFSLYADLSVEENLNFYASIFNTSVKENYDLIKDIYSHIEPFKKRKVHALSGGMKQKLALSCALVHKPNLLILDEPTTGVDAVSRMEFWELLKKMQKKNITILVSTPYMDEASLCDRIALMQNGNLLAVNTPQQIIKPLVADLERMNKEALVYRFGESIHVSSNAYDLELFESELRTNLSKLNHKDIRVNKITPLIEDCFLALMDKNVVE